MDPKQIIPDPQPWFEPFFEHPYWCFFFAARCTPTLLCCGVEDFLASLILMVLEIRRVIEGSLLVITDKHILRAN